MGNSERVGELEIVYSPPTGKQKLDFWRVTCLVTGRSYYSTTKEGALNGHFNSSGTKDLDYKLVAQG